MAISKKKKELMLKAKEQGINLSEDMSIFEMEKALSENSSPKEPDYLPSTKRGEY